MFAADVNILIGAYYETHLFNKKIMELFSSMTNKYKSYLMLKTVEMGFKRKIEEWSNNAVSIIICSISYARGKCGGEADIIEFNKTTEEKIRESINEFPKNYTSINENDIEMISEKINEILGKYTYYDLLDSKNVRSMMNEFYLNYNKFNSILSELKIILGEFFKLCIGKEIENSDIKRMVQNYFKIHGKRDVMDDEKIAEDLFKNSKKLNELKMFLTADRLFAKILNEITSKENILIEIKDLNVI